MITLLSAITILTSVFISQLQAATSAYGTNVLASKEFSLTNRYPDAWVNEVFADNILLTLMYLKQGGVVNKPIDWEMVRKPGRFALTLAPGDIFSFHNIVTSEYQNKSLVSTNAHFNFQDGFRSSGFLYGDGVCHLASLIYWVAKDAGLGALSPTNHDFRAIPEIPREYGVSIFTIASEPANSSLQNLYITNTKDVPITFIFDYGGDSLKIEVVQ